MMKNFLNFLVLIHIYTLLYFFLFITIIHYDEKFIVLSMLKYNEIFKTLYLLLCYVYIVLFTHTLFFFFFYCWIFSDIITLFLFLIAET